MSDFVICPKCHSEHSYQDRDLWICATCAHEWSAEASEPSPEHTSTSAEVRDAHGTLLQNGDRVTIIKDLKVKGAGSALKIGVKVKNIRVISGDDGHNISCKVEGFGAMNLKSEFVKKS